MTTPFLSPPAFVLVLTFKTENVNMSGFGLRKLRHKIVNKSYQLLIRHRSENQNKNSQKLFHNPEVLSFLGCQHWYRLMSRNQGEEFFKFKGGVSCREAAEKSKFFWKIIALRSKGMLNSDKHLDSNPQTMHSYISAVTYYVKFVKMYWQIEKKS